MLRPTTPFTLLIAAIPAFALAQPVLAQAAMKPITMSKSVFKDDTSRVCMPRETLGKGVDKTLPKTICDTQAGWESGGVTFKLK
ncbi:hypothetical protein [Sphingomonas oligophenolica]|uniref:Uncharacterized protein n=1 Tax=Sphingomonas oligophenolica TaxID=301154 RepID=A0A502CR95_9SPHN|nr:hypothetical protein [Sphingomonas oligophenolica]TPG15408.1 hypothetical protein EAH84_00950 [Sphingomonas oligophenolica]